MDGALSFSLLNVLFAVGAGVASVLSPCVLPVLPIVMAGRPGEHPLRPVAVVLGLTLSFVLMGVLTSLFGSVVGPLLVSLEKPVGVLIGALGILMLLDVNPFKRLQIGVRTRRGGGLVSGFVLGASLGLVWIPCVGPFLSSILAMVAGAGQVFSGAILLAFYALGLSIPMLLAGYASQLFRERTGFLKKHPAIVRVFSGLLLVGLSAWILTQGLFATPFA